MRRLAEADGGGRSRDGQKMGADGAFSGCRIKSLLPELHQTCCAGQAGGGAMHIGAISSGTQMAPLGQRDVSNLCGMPLRL